MIDINNTVILNDCISRELSITKGVPQESILGPILLSVYIGALRFVSSKFSVYMFADYHHNPNSAERDSLQSALE